MTSKLKSSRDPYRLASLPMLEPGTDPWPRIEAALRRRRLLQRSSMWLAAAAVTIVVIGISWQLPHEQSENEPTPAVDALQQPSNGSVTAGSRSLQALVGLSQSLEKNLRAMRTAAGVVPAQLVIYQVELEDLVSQVDEALNLQPESPELWGQRVNLLLDLNRLYAKQLRRDYSQFASL